MFHEDVVVFRLDRIGASCQACEYELPSTEAHTTSRSLRITTGDPTLTTGSAGRQKQKFSTKDYETCFAQFCVSDDGPQGGFFQWRTIM